MVGPRSFMARFRWLCVDRINTFAILISHSLVLIPCRTHDMNICTYGLRKSGKKLMI